MKTKKEIEQLYPGDSTENIRLRQAFANGQLSLKEKQNLLKTSPMIESRFIKLKLEIAQELYKNLDKKDKYYELFKSALETTFSKEELELTKGVTWEEVFDGKGYFIDNQYSTIHFHPNIANSTNNKNVFKTEKQAKSALAFAQLSHILAKYNEGREREIPYVDFSIITASPGLVTLQVSEFNYLSACHLPFYRKEDAQQSLSINHELWRQYWMLDSDSY